MKPTDKEFEKILKSDRIDCLICHLTIGTAKQILEHMITRHPDVYKEFAQDVNPELYRKEMEERSKKK